MPDTNDIWAAISRRGERPEPQRPEPADLSRFSTGVPATAEPAPQAPAGSVVSGELLDRVRGAVLRPRDADPQPATGPSTAAPQWPATPEPRGLTRREIRALHGEPEDEGPAAWQAPEARTVAPTPQQPVFAQPAFQQPTYAEPASAEPTYDDYDDEYYDEEYTPDPTIAIRAVPEAAPRPVSAPVDLPQYFQEPVGDDALRFSSPAPHQTGQPLSRHPFAEADTPFVEPWIDDEPASPEAFTTAPAHPPMDFVAPEQAVQFQSGPPSEITDLAGFEALIRQARSKSPEAPVAKPAQPSRPLAWADDEDASEGFTGLLSRQIQGSHGSSNALILPDDAPVDLTQAVSPSGDPFITGSLNLSRSLSTTGASDTHYEPNDIDRLYDVSQDEPAAGVAPVRASRAIAGVDRSFAGPRRVRGNVLPTILAIVAGAMAVGVVTLLVGSWVLKLF